MDPSDVTEEVVISGISGIFPYSDNIDELRENLFKKESLVSSEDCRWSTTGNESMPNVTGKIRHVSKFDASHFGIHRKLTEAMDPMMYIILEKSFEAIMDAGVNPNSLKGTKTTVVVGSCCSESDNVYDYSTGDGFGIMGHNRSMLASRVAYYLDVRGPSYAALSSWPAGFTALSIAYNSIRSGRSRSAIVGTSNLVLFPQMSRLCNHLGLLSPDGITRSFDAEANGYGRSEATVMLFLQRKQDAKRVYAEVLQSSVLCYGIRPHYVALTQDIIARHLEQSYTTSKVDPAQVEYLEADGAACFSNDRMELNAVDQVMLRNRKTPLLVGSVKSNIGHTEICAGMCSLIKVLIAMETGYIPPNMHYNAPLPGVPALTDGRIKVVTEKQPWKRGLAAINCAGIDGSFGHVVLKSSSKDKQPNTDNLPRLVTISSRTEEGVNRMLDKIESMSPDPEFVRLLHDIHDINIQTHLYRGYTVVGAENGSVREVQHFEGDKRPVWFIFSGMGSQWPGMGCHLMQLPAFAETIERCHKVLEPFGISVKDIITRKDPKLFDNILNSFVGIAAVQIGLVALLQKLGITPDGIIGHSVGELGCSLADGCLSEEEMILCAYSRGKASLEANVITGMMAAVGMGYSNLKDKLPPGIDIACHNGPDSCTISGPAEEMKTYVQELTKQGVFARLVNVSNIAYHSRYIAPVGPLLHKYLKKILPNPKPRSARWISTSVPEEKWGLPQWQQCSAEYHTNNLLSSVLFEEGSRHIPSNAICIELGPHGLLQAILRRALGPGVTNISLTQRGHERGMEFMLQAIGKLYMLGLQPKLAEIYPPVALPVSRGTPSISSLMEWEHSDDWPIRNYLQKRLTPGESHVQLSLAQGDTRLYSGSVLGGHVVLPATAHLTFAWNILTSFYNRSSQEMTAIFQNVIFHQPVLIPKQGSIELYMLLQRGSGMFEILLGDKLVTSGQVVIPEDINKEFTPVVSEQETPWMELSKDEIYKEFQNRGYQYEGVFQAISSVKLSDTCSVGKINWCNNWVAFTDCMLQLAILQAHEDTQDLRYPSYLRRFVVDMKLAEMTAGEELEVTAHRTTGVVRCKGMEIQGLETRPVDLSCEKNISYLVQKQQFVKHHTPALKSISDFLETSLQLAIENYHPTNKSRSYVSVAELKTSDSLLPVMETIASTHQNTWVELNTVKWPAERELRSNCVLVLADEPLSRAGMELVEGSGAFLLVRVPESIIWYPDQGWEVVMEQNCEGYRFSLLRQETQVSKSATTILLNDNHAVWLRQLREALRANKRVYLVSHGEPLCGIPSFLDNLARVCDIRNVRCVFILDRAAPPFSMDQEMYKKQLAQDLAVNVYLEGQWGTFRTLPLAEDMEEKMVLPVAQFSLEGIDVHYTTLTADRTEENRHKNKPRRHSCIEFSGIDNNKTRIMGLALSDSSKASQSLIWPVPKSWSLEDAATVPEAYSLAYYILKLLGNVGPKDQVLIHSGHTVTSQAAITVALGLGATVYTSVTSDQQRKFVKQLFPELNDNHILDAKTTLFESQIQEATNGKGVSLLINDLTDERMHASLRCVRLFGQMIHLSHENLTKTHHLGMSQFLKSIAFHGVSTNKLMNLSEKWRQELITAMEEGLESGRVKPLDRVVYSFQEVERTKLLQADPTGVKKVLLNLRPDLKKDVAQKLGLQGNPQNSYLIFGGKGDDWLNLAEWLVEQGARRLVIAQQSQPISRYLARHVNLLRSCRSVDIVLLSAHKASTTQGAASLIQEANNHGPLAGIFVLPLQGREVDEWDNSITQAVGNLDTASRSVPLRLFVCLGCPGVERMMHDRYQQGLPALSFLTNQHSAIKTILPKLDQLLHSSKGPVIIINVVHRTLDNAIDMSVDQLNSLLSSTVGELVDLGLSLEKRAVVEEVPTKSPRLKHVQEVPPVFLLSSLQHSSTSTLEALAKKLMYPALLVKMEQQKSSLQEYAAQLLQHIRQVYPSGPYVLVGYLWGGVVALEVASQLEAQGYQTQVFLLDAAPETLQKTASLLGKGSQLEVNLLGKLFSISSDKVKERILELPNWESRLAFALSEVTFEDNAQKTLVLTAVNAIHSHICNLIQYRPQHQLHGPVTLMVPTCSEDDGCSLLKICEHTVNIHKIGEDHKAMLTSPQVAEVINWTTLIK